MFTGHLCLLATTHKEFFITTIKITGIRAVGRHGANPGEQDMAQNFSIDIEIVLNAEADELSRTHDYVKLTQLVQRTVEQKRFKLIETMAKVLAKKIHQQGNIIAVKVVVHKPNAAKAMLVQDVSAEAKIGEI